MSVDTNTRLIRPADLTAQALTDLDPAAATLVREGPTLEVEDARPLARPEYLGRHRTAEPVAAEPWDPNPAWFPSEETRDLRTVAAVPLPSREPGVTLARAVSQTRVSRLQAALMRTAHRLRGAEGGDR